MRTAPDSVGAGYAWQMENRLAQWRIAPALLQRAPASAGRLRVEVAASEAGLRALAMDYARLQLVTGNTLPFALHEWHMAWCRHFLESQSKLVAQPMICAVRAASGACVGIVPMILTQRNLGLAAVRQLDILGPDPAITEIRAPLIEPGWEGRVAAAMQGELAGRREWDWVCWTGIRPAFGQALADLAELEWQDPLLDYVLELPSSWEELRAGLKRNIRESLRHGYNSLKRGGFDWQLRVVSAPGAVLAGIDRFLVLHAARADLHAGAKHPDYFAGTVPRAFLRDVCARLAERGAVRVFELLIGGAVVATRIGFIVGDGLYLYYSGFDPAWARYGVMTTTLAEAIKYAISQGLGEVNLSSGTDFSKTRWGPRVVAFGRAVQVARSLKSQFAYGLYQRARSEVGLPTWLGSWPEQHKRGWE